MGWGNNIAAQETPTEGCSFVSQDRTGAWTTSGIAWVPSLQDAAPHTAGAH
jgi:hypothetical protein